VHNNYDGKALTLPGGAVLDPADNPVLNKYVGTTLITSDGTTLLSADDKAGVAEIVAAVAYLKAHPELPHPAIEVIFTSDEEIGRGVEGFPYDKVKSKAAYTMDGGEEGTLEAECVNAHGAHIAFTGRSYHPGAARGKMVNAVSMVAAFLNLLPRNESPEATDGRFGYMWANDIQAGIETATVEVYMRDFDLAQNERRIASLHAYARAVEAAFPGGKVEVTSTVQYLNMKAKLDEHPHIVDLLTQAIRATGIEPRQESIRGGTDGSRLTEQGLPTPNIFTGGMNYHSRTEWVALEAMVRASNVIIELAGLWAREPGATRA
jgi:tripeptide aminopeptidase